MSLVACISAPSIEGALIPDAVSKGQLATVTLGEVPAELVAIEGSELLVAGDGEPEGVRSSPPPPHAATTAVIASKVEMRKVFMGSHPVLF